MTKNKYNIQLTENQFFTILNCLYKCRENNDNNNIKITKIITKFDNEYFN